VSAYDPQKGASAAIDQAGPARFPADLGSGVSPAGGWAAYRSGQKDLADLALELVHLPEGTRRAHLPLFSESVLKSLQAANQGGQLPAAVAAVTQPDSFAWSPDGRTLAFVGAADGPSSDLYLLDASSGQARRLTEGLNQVTRPTWSPDGLWVVFQEVTSFNGPPGWKLGAVWAAATDHNELRKLYAPPANSIGEAFLGWSAPDLLVVATQTADALQDIRAVPISARFVDPLYAGPVDHAVLDASSQALVFTETAVTGSGLGLAPGLYWLPGLKSPPQFIQAGAWDPLGYSPVLKRFTAAGEQGLMIFTPGGNSLLVKGEAGASPSPDGHWLAGWGPAANPGLRLYQPDGLLLQTLTSSPVSQVLWQPDSLSIDYLAGGNLFRASFPQAQPVQLDQQVDPGSLGWVNPPR